MRTAPSLGRLRLEPPPEPRHSEWLVFFRVLVVIWLAGHAFFDFVSAVRWLGELP